jgi:hypothetical protein
MGMPDTNQTSAFLGQYITPNQSVMFCNDKFKLWTGLKGNKNPAEAGFLIY